MPNPRRVARSLLASLLPALVAAPTLAVVPPAADTPGGAAAAALEPPPFILQVTHGADWEAAVAEADPALAAFVAEGGRWQARYDARTLRPTLIWGSGRPWLPGRGNDLRWKDVAGTNDAPSRQRVLALLEGRARSLLARNPELFRVPAGVELVVDPRRSGALDRGRVWFLTLAALRDGVPVERAGLQFRVNSGNLVQLGAALMTDDLASAVSAPRLPAAAALEVARARLQATLTAAGWTEAQGTPESAPEPSEVVDAGTLRILPWAEDARRHEGPLGEGLEYRLAWRVSWRQAGGHETWAADVDAVSGAVLSLFDSNRYACPPAADPQGRVTGGVYVQPIEEGAEVVRGMPYARVDHGGRLTADYNGLFPVTPGVEASTGLNGTYFDMTCAGCTDPGQVFVANGVGGDLALGMGGADEVGNGFSTPAERNCYYHLNIVRQLTSKHLDDAVTNGYLSRTTPATVNIDANCNAFFDGNGVNFFRSGGGCNNTGEIADVMQHEWGHGLDQFTGFGGDGARGEGMSDILAFLSTHDERLGPYFVAGNPNGIRNANELVGGTKTVSNIGSFCPGGPGPLGRAVHCEGGIFAQTFWHLALDPSDPDPMVNLGLVNKYGEVGGWHAVERLFLQHLPITDTYLPQPMNGSYYGVVVIDDDNGNLMDGTPNAEEINDAFGHHELTPSDPMDIVTASAPCAPPAAPALTLTDRQNAATGLWQVEVAWTASSAIAEYLVVRNDADGAGADVPVGQTFGPFGDGDPLTLLDDNVSDGVTYRYRVLALQGAPPCISVDDNAQTVAVGALAHLDLVTFVVDDSAANQNGISEPGEALTLRATVRNTGSILATGVFGTLSSPHPGVTVDVPVADFGDIAVAGQAASMVPHFSFQLDRTQVTCGEVVPFDLEIESPEGCSRTGFRLMVGVLSGFDVAASDDLETDLGWTVDPDGTDDATAGIWVREDPNPTNNGVQPGDDHTPAPGVIAWVTGNDPDPRPGNDDVDGGCTTLLSPTYDLGATSGLELAYWRYFLIATAFDDELLVEISNDGGGAWRELERVAQTTGGWSEAAFDLDAVLGAPADRVRLRFTICDTAPGSLLEALVDDVSFRTPIFTCEAPDPRPRLTYLRELVSDFATDAATGNENGQVDPGESVRVIVELTNEGNAPASSIVGQLTLLEGPPGTIISDPAGAWPDLAVGQTARSQGALPPHFEVTLPETAPCGALVRVLLQVTYEGPAAGADYSLQREIGFGVGTFADTVAFVDDMEAGDNGWTHGTNCAGGGCDDQDDWQRGALGGGSPWDPTAAFSGSAVWANDRGATIMGQPWNGDYRANVDNWLESPPIDCSSLTGTTLEFRRWLTVEDGDFDRARILVNGVEVWSNPSGADLLDTEWTLQSLDIGALADGDPNVVVRFELATDDGVNFGGWTLDDVRVFSREYRCEVYCRAVAPPAGDTPSLRATGAFDQDGVEFEWFGAPLAAGEEYRLYRGTDPADLSTLVTPAGHVSASHDDRAAPGPRYFYRVTRGNCLGELPLRP